MEEFFIHCRENNLQGLNKCLKNFYETLCNGLMEACEYGNSAIVSRLVQVPGLDINYHDEKYGETAAHLASRGGHTECVRILAEADRVDWNKRDKDGVTPLYSALER